MIKLYAFAITLLIGTLGFLVPVHANKLCNVIMNDPHDPLTPTLNLDFISKQVEIFLPLFQSEKLVSIQKVVSDIRGEVEAAKQAYAAAGFLPPPTSSIGKHPSVPGLTDIETNEAQLLAEKSKEKLESLRKDLLLVKGKYFTVGGRATKELKDLVEELILELEYVQSFRQIREELAVAHDLVTEATEELVLLLKSNSNMTPLAPVGPDAFHARSLSLKNIESVHRTSEKLKQLVRVLNQIDPLFLDGTKSVTESSFDLSWLKEGFPENPVVIHPQNLRRITGVFVDLKAISVVIRGAFDSLDKAKALLVQKTVERVLGPHPQPFRLSNGNTVNFVFPVY